MLFRSNFKKGSGPRNVSDKRFGKSLKGFYYHMREKWLTDDEEVKRLPEYQLTLVQQPKRYRKDVKDAAPENSRPAGNRGQ